MVGIVAKIDLIYCRSRSRHFAFGITQLEEVGCLPVGVAYRCGKGFQTFVAVETPGDAVLAPAHAVGNDLLGRERCPSGVGDGGDAIRQLHGLDDALYRSDAALVETRWNRSLYRSTNHRSVKHARQLH